MTVPALQWNKVSFSIRQGFWMRRKTIVHDLDMDLPKGTTLGLVGPNGAGKTTSIKLAAGLTAPEKGNVLVNGVPAVEPDARRKLGLLTETQYIYPHLRVREWLGMLAGFTGLKGGRLRERVDAVLELMALTDKAGMMMNTLSKGQLQRAGIAQALVHEPEILLLDEPMSGLDPYWRYRLSTILKEYKASGGTLLFSSHILADVERLSDRVALIEQGRVRWIGALSDMPRQVIGYEAVCRAENPGALKALTNGNHPERLPKGEWRIAIPIDKKEALLQLSAQNRIALESLRPVQEEIEAVLFKFAGEGTVPAGKEETA
ncbi:ABC transporter ATP-binding protein [Desulfococcus sp.]|uniref:ABC transporter ATP-binding protein n=1 Tax=Desulfococcus sp. TaxID=2025834 RepID=UPI0035935BFB